MYKIYADGTLIYDSTSDDYKIVKGSVTLETNKSGSFTFSIYPDHFYYDLFVKKKTVIKVLKDNEILFRGRVLNDSTDYWNNKVLTCEGELGFLHDSTIRPYTFNGTPEDLFKKFIEGHNAKVDDFKRFKVGSVTVIDPNNYIARSNSEYEDAYSNLFSRLIEDATGGYFYITHEDNEDIPTIHYLADFTDVSSQKIEFGSNLRDYVKTAKGDEIATVIIPLGKKDDTTETRLTITSVNGDKDYIEDPNAISLRGRIEKPVIFDDITVADNLLTKGREELAKLINQAITLELSAVDLHLLDKSIESFKINQYIPVVSTPHNFNATLLCNKQTIDLLKPDNDTVTLGYNYTSFTDTTAKINSSVSTISTIRNSVSNVDKTATQAQADANKALSDYENISNDMSTLSEDIEAVATAVTDLARSVSTNATNISTNADNIRELSGRVDTNEANIATNSGDIEAVATAVTDLSRSVSTNVKDIADIITRLEKLENPGDEGNL